MGNTLSRIGLQGVLMSINATTLTAAITATQTSFAVGSATGITAPNFTTGSGITWLLVEQELMSVMDVNTTTLIVTVLRGQGGTLAVAHVASSGVLAALPADLPSFAPAIKATQDLTSAGQTYGISAVVASAATIAASGPIFHVSGGTAINIITPYTGFVEGQVIVIFDSACTWTSSNVTNGISASGTSTTAGSAVIFYFDAATSRWYPSRLA